MQQFDGHNQANRVQFNNERYNYPLYGFYDNYVRILHTDLLFNGPFAVKAQFYCVREIYRD